MNTTDAAQPYHHGDLRNALLQASEQLLAEQGAASLSLRAVAKYAGVSHAAPYRHFRDKAALLRALAQSGFERLTDAIETAAGNASQNPELKLVEAGVAYVRHAVQRPALTQLMFGGSVMAEDDVPYQQASAAAFEALLTIIQEGVTAGAFRARDPRELALVAWTSMHGMAMLMMAGLLDSHGHGDEGIDDQVRAIARNVIYGISK
jgi:AcrR family transcriptional regulator